MHASTTVFTHFEGGSHYQRQLLPQLSVNGNARRPHFLASGVWLLLVRELCRAFIFAIIIDTSQTNKMETFNFLL